MTTPSQNQPPTTYNDLSWKQKSHLQRKLGTTTGFYTYYFTHLGKFKTQIDCFNKINLLHYKAFGEYKYADYNSFRKALTYHLKKRRKK